MVGKTKDKDYGKIRVFVYGTLKRGGGNNLLLKNANAEFLGYDSVTLDSSCLIDLGGFPAFVTGIKDCKDAKTVRGELWMGGDGMLRSLDILEGHPNFFTRIKTHTNRMNKNAWVYTVQEDWIDGADDFIEAPYWNANKEEKDFWTGITA